MIVRRAPLFFCAIALSFAFGLAQAAEVSTETPNTLSGTAYVQRFTCHQQLLLSDRNGYAVANWVGGADILAMDTLVGFIDREGQQTLVDSRSGRSVSIYVSNALISNPSRARGYLKAC